MVVFLALGSNLGNREQYLMAAITGLAHRGVHMVRVASIYSTEPQDVLDQPWFLNTVLEGATSLDPVQLLTACLEVERENLRKRELAKGPRTLDIDIIFYGSEIIRKPGLTIPHASFAVRRFVLAPLAEIAPEFVDPVTCKTVRQLLEATPDSPEVRRFAAHLL